MKRNRITRVAVIVGLVAAVIGIIVLSTPASQTITSATPTVTNTPHPTQCSIYTLHSRAEMGIADNGSFAIAQMIPGGQNSWVRLPGSGTTGTDYNLSYPIDYIKSLNANSYKTWSWAAQSVGTVYLTLTGYTADQLVDWPRVLASSEDVNNRNEVCVSAIGKVGSLPAAFIVGIPESANYQQYTNIPWLNMNLYGSYAGHPLLWKMPIFDPDSGFKTDKGPTTFAVDPAWLYQKIADITIPWMDSSTATMSVTATYTATWTPTVAMTPTGTATPTYTPTKTATPALTPVFSQCLKNVFSDGTVIWICK